MNKEEMKSIIRKELCESIHTWKTRFNLLSIVIDFSDDQGENLYLDILPYKVKK